MRKYLVLFIVGTFLLSFSAKGFSQSTVDFNGSIDNLSLSIGEQSDDIRSEAWSKANSEPYDSNCYYNEAGSLAVTGRDITAFSGLSPISSIIKNLSITTNGVLMSLSDFDSLESIGGGLSITNGALISILAFGSLTFFLMGLLRLFLTLVA